MHCSVRVYAVFSFAKDAFFRSCRHKQMKQAHTSTVVNLMFSLNVSKSNKFYNRNRFLNWQMTLPMLRSSVHRRCWLIKTSSDITHCAYQVATFNATENRQQICTSLCNSCDGGLSIQSNYFIKCKSIRLSGRQKNTCDTYNRNKQLRLF